MEHLQVTASSMVSFKGLLKITILDSLKMARINEWLLFSKNIFAILLPLGRTVKCLVLLLNLPLSM